MNDIISEWVEAFHKEHGRDPSPEALRMVQHIQAVRDRLAEAGRQNADPLPSDTFPALVSKAFPGIMDRDAAAAGTIADLWEAAYIQGRTSKG